MDFHKDSQVLKSWFLARISNGHLLMLLLIKGTLSVCMTANKRQLL